MTKICRKHFFIPEKTTCEKCGTYSTVDFAEEIYGKTLNEEHTKVSPSGEQKLACLFGNVLIIIAVVLLYFAIRICFQ